MHHLEFAQRLFAAPQWGRFLSLDVRHEDLLRLASGVLRGSAAEGIAQR
jgi:hypothetical protein